MPDDVTKNECVCECVKWNQWNKVTQCHRCGRIIEATGPDKDAPPEGEEVEAVWNILFNLIQGVKHIRGEGFSEALGEAAREIVELLQKEKKGGSDG